MFKGSIIIISGPSGVGKGTIIDLANNVLKNYGRVPTLTTRTRRTGGRQEKDRMFIKKNEFKQMIKKGQIVEYNYYNGHFYGTPRKELEEELNKGRNILLEIDINGAQKIKSEYPNNTILIFIWAKLSDIKNRLTKRGLNTMEEIEERINKAKQELKIRDIYDYQIENSQGKQLEATQKLIEICKKIPKS